MIRAHEKARRPDRAAVVRSLRDIRLLWERPPDPDPGNATAPVLATPRRQVDQDNAQANDSTVRAKRKAAR